MAVTVGNLTQPAAKLPVHVAIIMDGNGRWAERRNQPRSAGHREGLRAAKRIVKAASDIGIKYLTLYTFSTENWKRNEGEVSFLMRLIAQNLRKEYDFYRENRIRVIHSGNCDILPEHVRHELREVVEDTSSYDGLTVNLAINYGGRDEIVRSVNRWLEQRAAGGGTAGPLREIDLQAFLDHPDIPDPDIVIRTGGERRISNFLLWESAYSECLFSDKLWPDWTLEDFRAALDDYGRRDRKYGGIH